MAYHVFTYDPVSKIYTGSTYLSEHQMPSNHENLDEGFTNVDPGPFLDTLAEGDILCFDTANKEWVVTRDMHGSKCINVHTKQIDTFGGHGSLPQGYSSNIPDEFLLPYLVYNQDNADWVPNETLRNKLIDDIWNIRKAVRDEACDADIKYNGHLFHVDSPTSMNDLILAGQQALLSGDLTTTRHWVTADSQNVEITGEDILNILKQCGARRERLVFASNAAWEEDCLKSMEELLEWLRNYYASLNTNEE